MESSLTPETPKEEAFSRTESEAPMPASEPSMETSPEDMARLAVLEKQIDELRQELHLLEEVKSKNDAVRFKTETQQALKHADKKFLGLFRRKQPDIKGLLSDEKRAEITQAFAAAHAKLGELLLQQTDLEAEILDPEIVRERWKARRSDEYYLALGEMGRYVTDQEEYLHDQGEEYQDHLIDKAIEELKKKRRSN